MVAPMKITDQLVARIDAYLARTGMTATDFGLAVCNNRNLVRRLRKGTGSAETINTVGQYLDKNEKKAA